MSDVINDNKKAATIKIAAFSIKTLQQIKS